jgi:hypothetical protein
MGYMQTRTQFRVEIFRLSRARFVSGYQRGDALGDAIPVSGVGTAGFWDRAGLAVRDNGVALQLFGPYLSVYPGKAIALARAALKRLGG